MIAFKKSLFVYMSIVFTCISSPDRHENQKQVHRFTLDNGFTVLVKPVDSMQKVAIQLWINAGSKDEQTGQRGIAHLIEHMLFKGTKLLSESDIWAFTEKISGTVNAATSYDYTNIVFDVPIDYWHTVLPVLSEMFTSCTFKQELLNSELKAVIQEFKMYRDNNGRSLLMALLASVYYDHPYHYPVIGYKHDLYNVTADQLFSFYKKHYVPNNAALVIVGNVKPEEVLAKANDCFGQIPAHFLYKKEIHNITNDIRSQTVTLYRDIQTPFVSLAYKVPGIDTATTSYIDLLPLILTNGKTSRLYKKLIDDLQLVHELSSYKLRLHETDLFCIHFAPNDMRQADKIIDIVNTELTDIAINGLLSYELEVACKKTETSFYATLENNHQMAHAIGCSFWATGDENAPFAKQCADPQYINAYLKQIAANNLRPTMLHKGYVLPLPPQEKDHWLAIQQASEKEDSKILNGKERTIPVEEEQYTKNVVVKEATCKQYPKPELFLLTNGIRVLACHTDNVPLIRLFVNLKPDGDYEPIEHPGLFGLLNNLIIESGTKDYTAQELADKFNQKGINYHLGVWSLSATMMSDDLLYALPLLYQKIALPILDISALDKIKQWNKESIKSFWDDERSIASLILDNQLYGKKHQWASNVPTENQINAYTYKQLTEAYNTYISPHGGTIFVVGDIKKYKNLKQSLDNTFGQWQGPTIDDIQYPSPKKQQSHIAKHYLLRDQIVIKCGALSVDFYHPDRLALALYDNHLHERLFELREQTGAFYGIGGTLLNNKGTPPSSIHIATKVSEDRLNEVYSMLLHFIHSDIEEFSHDDLNKAKQSLIRQMDEMYASNNAILSTLINLEKHQLPHNYYEQRCQQLHAISLEDVKRAVKTVFDQNKMNVVLVGRIGQPNTCWQTTRDLFKEHNQCEIIG